MVNLFDKFGPCVILIDELVAYMRNIYGVEGPQVHSNLI
jgi:hypothetical protein